MIIAKKSFIVGGVKATGGAEIATGMSEETKQKLLSLDLIEIKEKPKQGDKGAKKD